MARATFLDPYRNFKFRIKIDGNVVAACTKCSALKITVECRKNQIAPPFKKGDALIEYGKGISFEHGLIALGVQREVIEVEGKTKLVFDGEALGAGVKRAVATLKANEALREKLFAAVKTW